MRNKFLVFILIYCFSSLAISGEVKKNKNVKRIVSLYSAYTEILTAIGAEKLIVGTTLHDAKRLKVPSVGNHMNPSIEAVLACKPDLVIAFSRNKKRFVKMAEYLKKLNIDFRVLSPHSIKEVKLLILELGKLTGHQKEAELKVAAINQYLKKTKDILQSIPEEQQHKKVFLEVRQAPAYLTCGKKSIVVDILKYAGCVPLAVGDKSVNIIDVEKIITLKPDFYLQQIGMMNRNPASPDKQVLISQMSVVKNGHFGVISEKLISRPSVNIGRAVYEICKMVYSKNKSNLIVKPLIH